MEASPNTPRQRNRRADRQITTDAAIAPSPAEQFAVPSMQQPVSPVQAPVPLRQPVSPAPAVYVQPVQPAVLPRPVSPTVYSQQSYVQPRAVTPPAPVYPPYQQQTPPSQTYPQPQAIQPPARMPAVQQQVHYAPRPGSGESSWQSRQIIQPAAEMPHARAHRGLSRENARAARAAQKEGAAKARQEALEKAQWQAEKAEWEAEKSRRAKEKAAATPDSQKRKKVPGWLTTALSLSLIFLMAMVAAYYLMQAYLVQQEEARIAAHDAILHNYHVTEQADGSMRVTWQDTIEQYAAQYNLQPAFVTAIIRNESSFRTNAESSVGARGLMQMMPDTAEWIAGKLDDHNYDFDRMWDAETNIRYGCWYLGYLSRLFRGDAMLVSAAYHAGQTTVTQWLSDPAKSSDGVTLDLDRMADGPTKQYIGRVTQTYGIYQSLLYPDEAFAAKRDAVPAGNSFGITIER